MAANCPRLQLNLPSNTTSFKRSFDELGLDLDASNDNDGAGNNAEGSSRSPGASADGGNDRNKRARSESDSSDADEFEELLLSSASASSSSSSISFGSSAQSSTASATALSSQPTVVIDPRSPSIPPVSHPAPADSNTSDVEMASPIEPPTVARSPTPATFAQHDQLRLSLERFNAFDTNMSVLRHSHSPLPGPSLPPSTLSSFWEREVTLPDPIPTPDFILQLAPFSIPSTHDAEPAPLAPAASTAASRPSSSPLSPSVYFDGHGNWLDRPLSPPRASHNVSRPQHDDASRTAGVSSGTRSPVTRRTSPLTMPPAYMQSLLSNLAERTQSLRTATSRLNDTLGEMYMRERMDPTEQGVAASSRPRQGQEEHASRLRSIRDRWDDLPVEYEFTDMPSTPPSPHREAFADWLIPPAMDTIRASRESGSESNRSRADNSRPSASRPLPSDAAEARSRALDVLPPYRWPMLELEPLSLAQGGSSLRADSAPRSVRAPAATGAVDLPRASSRAEHSALRRRFGGSLENPSTSDSDSDVELFRQYMERAEAPPSRAADAAERSSGRTDSMRGVFREPPAFRRRSSLGGHAEGTSAYSGNPHTERIQPSSRDWVPPGIRNSNRDQAERDRMHSMLASMRNRSDYMYNTRPGPSNSLMSENAAERRRRSARDEVLFPRQSESSMISQGGRDNMPSREHTAPSDASREPESLARYLFEPTSTDARIERRSRDPMSDLTSDIADDHQSTPERGVEHWYLAALEAHERLRFTGDEDEGLTSLGSRHPPRDTLGPRATPPDIPNRPSARFGPRAPGVPRSSSGWHPWTQDLPLLYASPDLSQTSSNSSSTARPRSSATSSTRRRSRLEDESVWSSEDMHPWDDTRWLEDHPFDTPAVERSMQSPEPAVPSSSQAAALFASGPLLLSPNIATLEVNRRNRSSRLATLRSLRSDPSLERVPSPFPHLVEPPNADRSSDSLHHLESAEEPRSSRRSEYDLNARAELRSSLDAAGIFRSPVRSSTPSPPPRPANVRHQSVFSRPPPGREASSVVSTASDRFYDSIDLNAFHDGPFRASLERSVQLNRRRSALQTEHRHDTSTSRNSGPPSLPPLRFQRDQAPSMSRPRLPSISQMSTVEDTDWSSSSDIWQEVSFDLADEPNDRSEPALRHALRRPSSTLDRVVGTERPRGREGERHNMDVHSIISRRPRTEASRIVDDNEGDVLGGAEVSGLRPDGTNFTRQRQLIDRYRRERSEDRRREADLWGDIDGEDGFSGQSTRGPTFSNPDALAAWRRHRGSRPPGLLASRAPHLPGSAAETSSFSARPSDLGTDTRARRTRSPSLSPTRDSERAGEGRFMASRMARLRAARRRNADLIGGEFGWMSNDVLRLGFPPRPGSLRSRNLGDYMRDEDLDTSYEGLLHLTGLLGEARSRGTPASVMSSLPSGIYKDWAKPGESEERCPICLDDYQATDPVLKVTECSHWFHKGCLEQWLKGAGTCPVCRGRVGSHGHSRRRERPVPEQTPGPSRSASSRVVRRNGGTEPQDGTAQEEDGGDGDGERTPRLHPRPPWRFE